MFHTNFSITFADYLVLISPEISAKFLVRLFLMREPVLLYCTVVPQPYQAKAIGYRPLYRTHGRTMFFTWPNVKGVTLGDVYLYRDVGAG